MSFSDLFTRIRQYDQHAEVIFDREEPIGRATDLVMPRRRWFNRRRKMKFPRSRSSVATAPNDR